MQSAFISDSRHDKKLARQIAQSIRELGGRVWIDEAELRIGDSLIEKIRMGIDGVDFVIAVLSRHSVSSRWVQRELEVAQYQEFEGKRVKVLPVLAGPCDLPGFLKGKYYADMTTPAAKKMSLRRLLERLGGSKKRIEMVLRGERIAATEDDTWIDRLRQASRSEDPSDWYSGLSEAAGAWRRKGALLEHLDVLETVCSLLEDESLPHFKIQALAVVGMVADEGFAYRIEPMLGANEPQVAAAAVRALWSLGAKSASASVMETLRRTENAHVRRECLEFFSRVDATSSIALSLLDACNEMLRTHEGDTGIELLVGGALGRQLASDDNNCTVGRRVIELLRYAGDAARLALLEAIREDHEDVLFTFRADLRMELGKALDELSRSENAQIAAVSWMVRVLGAYVVEETRDRSAVWPAIGLGTESALENWFDMLEDYHVGYVFDEAEDMDGLVSLLGRFERRLDERVYSVLCELDFDEGLDRLVQGGYEPTGFKKLWILRKLALADGWQADYDALLDTALRDVSSFARNTGTAWALLSGLKAGRIEIGELFAKFPGSLDGSHGDRRLGRHGIVEALEDLRVQLDATGKRRLTRLLGKIGT